MQFRFSEGDLCFRYSILGSGGFGLVWVGLGFFALESPSEIVAIFFFLSLSSHLRFPVEADVGLC